MQVRHRSWIIYVLFLLFSLMQYQLWAGEGNLLDAWRLKRTINTQYVENKTLLTRNRVLTAEVKSLKSGLEAVEERARTELGMIGPNESFVQVVESVGVLSEQ